MILIGSDLLLQESEDVSLFDGEKISNQLIEVLVSNENGVGLSAPQIGVYKNVFVMRAREGFRAYINPKILETKDLFIFHNEGCLSFPGQRVNTLRYGSIVVDSLNRGVELVSHFAALIVQHEIDHLLGKTMFHHQVPEKYDLCFCGSSKKFKFCCYNSICENVDAHQIQGNQG